MNRLTAISIRKRWALGATVLVLLAVVLVGVIVTGAPAPTSAGHLSVEGPSPTPASTPSPASPGSLAAEQQSELEQSINRMRAVPPVDRATSARYPAVSAQARQQPDLYAAAFVRELLTQDYRTDRARPLAWVQSESAQSSDPLVVGLTPADLRDRMAVASVQDGVNGPAPVPTPDNWADLAARQGRTAVQVQRVIEPVSWASAVASGQISDPGVTARQVDAQVTLQTMDHGKAATQRFSVALVVNLEGPPVRAGYGFVALIIYNVAAAG
jgi:hypothetical protein